MKVPEDLLAQAYSDWVYLNDDGTPRDTDDPRLDKEETSMQETALGILGVVTNWFAAHELVEAGTFTITDDFRTFVDLTECGPQCPACNRECFDYPPICDASWEAAPLGQPCPVLAARKETT